MHQGITICNARDVQGALSIVYCIPSILTLYCLNVNNFFKTSVAKLFQYEE